MRGTADIDLRAGAGPRAVRDDETLLDPAAASDPFLDYDHMPINDGALQPLLMHDAADGHRLGSRVIDTTKQAELHGLRVTPQGIMLTGRVFTEVRADGSGWDAFVARISLDGTLALYRTVDVDRGDVLFDIAALPSGRYLAFGATGYVQNPAGASVSEEVLPLLALLDADGSVLRRFSVWDGPRQDQLRTVVRVGDRWIVGGMRNGPGTHSGDGRPDLITADGFPLEMNGLPAQ